MTRRILPLTAFAVFLLAGFLATPAFSQWSSLPTAPNTPVTVPNGVEVLGTPRLILRDAAGGAFLLWADKRNGNFDVFAQHETALGAPGWGAAGKPVATTGGNKLDFQGVADGAGGLFVVWEDTRDGTSRLYAQHLDANGDPVWATNGVLASASGLEVNTPFQWLGLVASADCGLFVHYSNSTETRVQRLNFSGGVASGWPAGGVVLASTIGYVQSFALVPSQTTGDTEPGVLALMTSSSGATAFKVRGDGTVGFTTQIPLGNIGSLYGAPVSAESDGDGGILMVGNANQYMWAHRVTKDGTLAWPVGSALVNDNGGQYANIVPSGDGGAIVTWRRTTTPGTTLGEIRAQKLSPTGAHLWGTDGILVFSGEPLGQYTSSGKLSVSDGAGGVIVGWRSYTPTNTFTAQRLDPDGNALWGSGVVVCSGVGTVDSMVTDDSTGAIYLHTAGGPAFYSMRTTLTGALGSNSPLARLANMSARAQVGGGDDVLIIGFVIGGGNEKLLIRGIGPTLGIDPFNLAGALPDAQLTLYNSANAVIGSNDDWGQAANAAEIASTFGQGGAFSIAADSKDSAILVDLAPGLYTAILRSGNGAPGLGLIELYEVGGATNAGRLVNMSVRAHVGTGNDVLIPGIYIGGSQARTLLIRAVGPTLAHAPYNVAGVVPDPHLTLFGSGGVQLAVNDNWETPNGSQISTFGSQVGAFALDSGGKDAGFLITLSPGLYTAHISGVGNTTGVGLVELYEIP